LTAVAFWQLRAISSTPIGRLADRFSVDPVLVVTPALGLLTGAVLTLRIVPLLARTGERLATAGRSVVGALTGWQLARRPGGQARAAFLLVMAISIGFFAASYAATWNDSQADQADFQVGADLRVLPNRRTNDSITDLHLTAAHERLDPVEASMPLQRIVGSLPGSGRRGTFLLLDATKAADIVSLRPDGAPGFAALMDELVAARPRLPGLAVPGEPERLEFTFDAFEEPIEVDDPRVVGIFGDDLPVEDDGGFLPPAFDGAVDIVVQDGDGFLHRLPAGTIEPNVGPQLLTVELTETATADLTLTPIYPLTIVDLQIRGTAPLFLSRAVTVELLGIDAVDATGDAATIALTPSDEGSWIPSTLTQGRSTGQPTIAVAATDERVSLDLDTAASDPSSTAQVLFSARPGRWSVPDAFPVVVSHRWLAESRTEIGDDVSFSSIRALDDSAVVAGAVDVFPTVDPITDHAVIVDLPTVQMVDYELGRPIRGADEAWLAVGEAGTTAVAATLSAQPFDSVAVEGRQRRYVSLTTDPAALATIGAFAIGFVVAAVFAVLVFVAVTAVSARERRDEFTLLRAFGLGPRQFVAWMTTEQLVMVALSVVLGVAVGFGLSAAVLPLISIGQQGAPAVPPAEPRYPWATIAVVVLAPLAALVATIVVTALRRERDSLGSRLRDGTT
ncbi:MAG: ABC transporter permease, partial [Acidimicrobiia bacterium]|nr:ABC transporter permease [Acidimicrobiia bacterium]